jgi:N-acyl-D-amino-acid deacylase
MTGRPARRLGLADRGLVKKGYRADLVLLHRDSVIDRSTYESPRVPAAGFVNVWIDGTPTLWDGVRTDNLPGRAVRNSLQK